MIFDPEPVSENARADELRAAELRTQIDYHNEQYFVFDAPEAKGGFEDRIAHIEKVMKRAAPPHARVNDRRAPHVDESNTSPVVEVISERDGGIASRIVSSSGSGLRSSRPKKHASASSRNCKPVTVSRPTNSSSTAIRST